VRSRHRTQAFGSVVLAFALASGQISWAPPAAAQTAEQLDKARLDFRDGLSLEAAGNWAGALAKFQSVGRVKLTPQVRFHIGRCHEQLGRLNEALGEYRLAEHEAQQQNLSELPAMTQARAALEGRVPKLVIRRGEGAELARIELDGVEIGEAQLGKALGVDPGPHNVVARLPDKREFQRSAIVKESETVEVILDVPADLAAAPESSGKELPTSAQDTGKKKNNVLPWVFGSVGVAGLAASGAFYLLRSGAKSDLEEGCNGNVCPESLEDKKKNGELYGTLSLVSLGVGVVGIGVATYLLVSAPSSGSTTASAGRNGPVFVPIDVAALPQGGGSVTWRARF
jgi:tetratricopeptide (TPR) repeat protein